MQTLRPILTQHRFRRHVLWLLAMLSWIAAALIADRSAHARHRRQRGDVSFACLSRWVTRLLMLRALHIVRPRQRRIRFMYWRRGFNTRPSRFRRSLLGARLRRMLKHKDPATHIAQLIAVLRDLDKYGAQLAHRIRHRLRRLLREALVRAPIQSLLAPPPPPLAFADSS